MVGSKWHNWLAKVKVCEHLRMVVIVTGRDILAHHIWNESNRLFLCLHVLQMQWKVVNVEMHWVLD